MLKGFLKVLIASTLLICLFLLFGLLLFEAFTLSELSAVESYNKELTMDAEKLRNHIISMRDNDWNKIIGEKDKKLDLFIKNLEDNKLIIILPGGKIIENNFYTAFFLIQKGYINDPCLRADVEKIKDASLFFKQHFTAGNEDALFLVGDEATLKRLSDYDFRKPLKAWFKKEHMQEGLKFVHVTNPYLGRKPIMIYDMLKVNEKLALFLARYWHPEWIRNNYKWEHKITYPEQR